MAIEPRCSRERMAGAGRWTPGPARHLVLALMAALLTIAACAHPQSLNVPKAAASSAAMTSASSVYDPTALDAPEDVRGQAATARTAALVVAAEAAGQPMSLADAQIAGICMAGNHELATRNVGDFSTASGINLINPFQQ